MRMGQNPAKSISTVQRPERITVAVLNYIPVVAGYYAELPQVLEASLTSLRAQAGLPFDLLVFDNGSCREVQQQLLDYAAQGMIQHLWLSERNLGKGGAWNILFAGAPGEIIAYADNDVLYYPGWLAASVELLEHFPNVGMVTSRPFRTQEAFISRSIEWAKSAPGAELREGQFLPYDWYYEFSKTLGYPDEQLEREYASTRDFRVTYRGREAQLGGSHWQFVTWKKVIQEMLPFQMDKPMGQVKQLDERINASGYLRLMPVERFVQNMSNAAPATAGEGSRGQGVRRRRWQDIPLLRAVLLRIYDRLFKLYYNP